MYPDSAQALDLVKNKDHDLVLDKDIYLELYTAQDSDLFGLFTPVMSVVIIYFPIFEEYMGPSENRTQDRSSALIVNPARTKDLT